MNAHRHLLCSLLMSLTLVSTGAIADDDGEFELMDDVIHEFAVKHLSDDFKVQGWAITPNIHFGQARIADETGIGIVVDQGRHQWGFSDKGVAYHFQF